MSGFKERTWKASANWDLTRSHSFPLSPKNDVPRNLTRRLLVKMSSEAILGKAFWFVSTSFSSAGSDTTVIVRRPRKTLYIPPYLAASFTDASW